MRHAMPGILYVELTCLQTLLAMWEFVRPVLKHTPQFNAAEYTDSWCGNFDPYRIDSIGLHSILHNLCNHQRVQARLN